MKKPEKFIMPDKVNEITRNKLICYNQACDEWSKYHQEVVNDLVGNVTELTKELNQTRIWLNNMQIHRDKLQQQLKESETVLSAWHSVFQTSQLSHASERLSVAERTVERLQQQLNSCQAIQSLEVDIMPVYLVSLQKHVK